MNLTPSDADVENIISQYVEDCEIITFRQALFNHPPRLFLEYHFYEYLERHYGSTIDFSKTFQDKKLIFIFDESMEPGYFIGFHQWITKKSCNIKNVLVITTHTIGIVEWYDTYLTTLSTDTRVKVVEAPLMSKNMFFYRYLKNLPKLPDRLVKKEIRYLFSMYAGGSHNVNGERLFLATLANQFNNGFVDFLDDVKSPDRLQEVRQDFENYLEQLTNFCDRATVDTFLRRFDQLKIINNEKKQLDEPLNLNGFQFDIDSKSAIGLIRETMNSLPYGIITEKTIRTFLHLQIPLPISGPNSINHLKQLGFVFDESIVNYDYQSETLFLDRITKINEMLKTVSTRFTLRDLEEYMLAKSDMFCYNYNHIYSGEYFKILKNRIVNALHT